jgi:glycosyltransferase involved in cell wall biosynthesis
MTVDASQPAQATVLVVTKNRKDDLRKCLRSTVEQTAAIEILVIDDASDDGTPRMLADEFPQVRLHRRETSAGCVVNRNVGAQMACAPIIVTIDDDATFRSPDTIEVTLREFDHPRVAAVAMPLIDSNSPGRIYHRAPDTSDIWVTHKFTGAIHALRRDVFLKFGGFRGALVHFGEEEELCLRFLDGGYITRMGTATPAYHDLSPIRNRSRERYYAARNVIFWSWMNAPASVVGQRMVMQTAREFAYAAKYRMPWTTLKGIFAGSRESFFGAAKRRPVSKPAWELWRDLRRNGPFRLRDIRSRLPEPLPIGPVSEALVGSQTN